MSTLVIKYKKTGCHSYLLAFRLQIKITAPWKAKFIASRLNNLFQIFFSLLNLITIYFHKLFTVSVRMYVAGRVRVNDETEVSIRHCEKCGYPQLLH